MRPSARSIGHFPLKLTSYSLDNGRTLAGLNLPAAPFRLALASNARSCALLVHSLLKPTRELAENERTLVPLNLLVVPLSYSPVVMHVRERRVASKGCVRRVQAPKSDTRIH